MMLVEGMRIPRQTFVIDNSDTTSWRLMGATEYRNQ